MDTVVRVLLGCGVMVAVYLYCARETEEDPGLLPRLRAQWERRERLRSLPEPVGDMDDLQFMEYVAGLCRRDGCADMRRIGGPAGLGHLLVGRLPDGRTLAVKCWRTVGSNPFVNRRRLREFDEAARAELGAEATVFVAVGEITRGARRFAARRRPLLVDLDLLEPWSRGTPLTPMLGDAARPRRFRRLETASRSAARRRARRPVRGKS